MSDAKSPCLDRKCTSCQVGLQQDDRIDVKIGLIGDASTSELKKVTDTLNAQTSKFRSKLKTLKADVLAVAISKAHKQLSDAIGNGDKVLADSDGKISGGDQTRNNLTKVLDSTKNVFNNDKNSILKTFVDDNAKLGVKVKTAK